MPVNLESIQLINTALIKLKEKKINPHFEERLKSLGDSPVLEILNKSILQLAESQKITRDQAALALVEFVLDLHQVWDDFIVTEGIDKLKNHLSGN